jgi:polyphosphate kinase 2 (PPK2 family)
MTEKAASGDRSIHDRIMAERLDSFDEELELEIDDDRLDALTNEFSGYTAKETVDRRVYFKELFRLQGELVKLQDWVQHHSLKMVVIFEGRDSARKRRRHQAHHSAAQSAGLPRRRAAGAERA